MYRVNVSLFIKTKDYHLLDNFLRSKLVPLIQSDEGVTQVDILEVIPQGCLEDMNKPIEDKTLALLISLVEEEDFNRYLSTVLGERLGLLSQTFGERALYYVTPMRQIKL